MNLRPTKLVAKPIKNQYCIINFLHQNSDFLVIVVLHGKFACNECSFPENLTSLGFLKQAIWYVIFGIGGVRYHCSKISKD